MVSLWGFMGTNRGEQLSLLAMSALHEMANIGLGHALKSLSELTDKPFNMAIPQVDLLPAEHVHQLTPDPEAMCVGVLMPFCGDVEGHLAFLFPWASAQTLWRMLLGSSPETPADVDEIATSAMLEIGNIINSSFLAALSDFTQLHLESTPPMLGMEMVGALASSIMTEAEMSDSVVLALETSIFDAANETQGYFMCIPSRSGLSVFFKGLGIEEAA